MKYKIGDKLQDEHGNRGIVVISWNDGEDISTLENDAAHADPIIISDYEEGK